MRLIRDNLATIVAGIAVACVLGWSIASFGPWHADQGASLHAVVHDGDGGVHRLPLDANDALDVSTSLGANTIVVEDGAARIIDADCPGKDCMHQRPISKPGEQLVCLPHRLWVEVVPTDAPDSSSMDVNAVTWEPESAQPTDVDLVTR